ncbi:PP2C family protein-serine/threonine phosphatase [Glaciimonas soli]|uniref:SpoIIE family protein phosphatase n=1 Tax=Glaciimonas soli TaxID=2590999 RepID=A0A843YTC2_9BURK|nr:protein phosphatase 2C domain-containing protein [Glaciimonas soli]MQR00502.1 SpoIIE family protein phosphatase [Glaciimonas soli]
MVDALHGSGATAPLPVVQPLRLDGAQLTYVGDRRLNQDALGSMLQDDLACMVIADGIGSKLGGEVAARIVVETVINRFRQEQSFGARALQSYIAAAETHLAQRQRAEPGLKEMSATIAAVLIDQKNRCMVFAHMGDTRIYVFRDKQLVSVTKDHSLVQQFVEAGHCSVDQLRHHPRRSILFAAIGAEGDVGVEVTPALDIEAGDALLLCTDGFWEWITENEMVDAIASTDNATEWLNRMAQIVQKNAAATASRSRDNCTALTIFIV